MDKLDLIIGIGLISFFALGAGVGYSGCDSVEECVYEQPVYEEECECVEWDNKYCVDINSKFGETYTIDTHCFFEDTPTLKYGSGDIVLTFEKNNCDDCYFSNECIKSRCSLVRYE